MVALAVANLLQNKTRLMISVGGLGLALALVLFFGAVFDGATGRLTAYVDHAGADVWVSQAGVRTMHMSTSALPPSVVGEVKAVPGVDQAVPILYAGTTLRAGDGEYIVYVFGVAPDAPVGGPWRIVAGAATPGAGEIIIDRAIAAQAGVGVGDAVTALGQPLRVVGLTAGTSTVASSASFVRMEDFARARGGSEGVSYVLVTVTPGESPATVAERIGRSVGGVTAQTRQQFATQERALVADMSTDLITIMNTAGFLTGLAVVVLTIYIATVSRRKEYGVLKAMGTRNARLYEVVAVQAFVSVALGLLAGLGLTLLLSATIPRINELLVLSVGAGSVLRVAVVSMVLAGVAALLPARQIAGLEPAAVVRRG
jgi:putative ABC transport system permease protein